MTLVWKYIIYLCLFSYSIWINAQETQRPIIWIKQDDKPNILDKIETQPWANSFFQEFTMRLDNDISLYEKSPAEFFQKLPFDWRKQESDKIPPLKTFYKFTDSNSSERYVLNRYLQIAIDCGVLYFLTEKDIYAQCALDILHTFIEGISQIRPSEQTGNGGWIYPDDHLREARVIGAQVPIIYDFIESYILKGNKAYDIGSKGMVDFSILKAQKVFLTYATLAAEHGHTGSNWSVLESFSLVQNALALNDLEQRKKYLDYYLVKGTDRQDALPEISAKYKKEGDVYPETSQYSNGVAGYTTRMIILLDHYDPNLKLGHKHYKIPYSLDRWNSLRYPNGEIIRFGDGKRTYNEPFHLYDLAYSVGKQSGVEKLTDKFGPLVTKGLSRGDYVRENVGRRSFSAAPYFTPIKLFWLNETKDYPFEDEALPRTDNFPHAGVFLQRNLSDTGNEADDLMCFVGGAHMVHGHAGGMDMELYGLGEVLGVDHGRGKYRTDLHENYSRLFAAHNTVIVNGKSQGEGGWVNLGINSTELITMEPMPNKKAISSNHSYTRTSFIDDRGEGTEARQERTMAIVRTSATTGYYVDVFRSESNLPNQYHDYLYHNIGDELNFTNEDLALVPDNDRFMMNANGDHIYNKKFRNPGWHFFKEVVSSKPYKKDVKASFKISKLRDQQERYMNVYIPGNENREYTKVMAPQTFEAPPPYDEMRTPTLVIRQQGECWKNPFAVIYQPTFMNPGEDGIQSVTKLEEDGIFKGFKVISKIDGQELIQYIIIQEDNDVYIDEELQLFFKGSFAVITLDHIKEFRDMYIGHGEVLTIGKVTIRSKNNSSIAAYVDVKDNVYNMNASENSLMEITDRN